MPPFDVKLTHFSQVEVRLSGGKRKVREGNPEEEPSKVSSL